jgi:molecular chaperone DnaK
MIVGIDLGTTNSGVSVVKNGAPQMLPNGDERIIPSVVGYSPRGQWLVGTPARNQYVLDPDNTVRSIKRQMGSDTQVQLGERTFTPPEISAFILRELKTIAERNLGQEITEAVITVPAYFSDAARRATRDAGKIAGFDVRRIINEPTAAALAYGLNMIEDQMVLVYDLGGGTFDVSLVELMGGIVEVRASHGNTHLGGDDFDLRLTEMIAQRFQDQHDIDLRQDRRAWARLIRASEAAKIELSSHPFAWIREEYIAESRGVPLHLEYEISRQEFIGAIEDLLEQTLVSIEQVISDGQVAADEISQVLLVGGSTRIPAIRDIVANYLDTEPHMSINPEEVVALGAGVQAAIIDGVPIDAILVDVTPHSLGIEVAEVRMGRVIPDRYNVLIHRNTTIPVTKEEIYATLHPEQDTVQIAVYQGEKSIASENVLLDKFMITDLEPEQPGQLAKVTVRFDFDVNGILKVTAQDRKTGQAKDITIEASKTRLSETDIMQAQKRIDQTVAQSATLAVLTGRAKQFLESDKLDAEDRDQLEEILADIEAVQEAQAAGKIDELENLPRLSDLEDELLDFLFDLENDPENDSENDS